MLVVCSFNDWFVLGYVSVGVFWLLKLNMLSLVDGLEVMMGSVSGLLFFF